MAGYGSLFDWLIFIGVIIGLIYTMNIIKNEKNTFLESARPLDFHGFSLLVPTWWTKVINEEDRIRFKRTDTYYDWKATFTHIPFDDDEDIKEKLVSLIQSRKIEFDPDTGVILDPSQFQDHPATERPGIELLRIEGTGTEDEEERVYYDTFIVKDNERKCFLFCESRSSILNGMLEGPYFEELINRITVRS